MNDSKQDTTRALDPEKLFKYARTFADRSEASGNGTAYPTVRQCAQRFRVRQAVIEEICSDYIGEGYMGLIVGFRTGAGYGSYSSLGEYQVEAYH